MIQRVFKSGPVQAVKKVGGIVSAGSAMVGVLAAGATALGCLPCGAITVGAGQVSTVTGSTTDIIDCADGGGGGTGWACASNLALDSVSFGVGKRAAWAGAVFDWLTMGAKR